jgi:hypothetical protein
MPVGNEMRWVEARRAEACFSGWLRAPLRGGIRQIVLISFELRGSTVGGVIGKKDA